MNFIKLRNVSTSLPVFIGLNKLLLGKNLSKVDEINSDLNITLKPLEEKKINLFRTSNGKESDFDGGTIYLSVWTNIENVEQNIWAGYVPTRTEHSILIDPEFSCVTHDNLIIKGISSFKSKCDCKKKSSFKLSFVAFFCLVIILLLILFFYL